MSNKKLNNICNQQSYNEAETIYCDSNNKKYDTDVPLILMNSFNTEKITNKIIYKYDNIRTFTQSIFPRISMDTLLPVCGSYKEAALYPPGHVDLFQSIERSGMLDKLIG